MSQDTINLQVEPREVTGKSVKHLRKEGQIPAVIHDHGKESVIVQGDAVAMLKAFKAAGKHHPIELRAGTKLYTAMIKTAEFEPRKHQLNHIVFNAVSATQKVEAEVPIEPQYAEGNDASPAERAGFMVLSTAESIMVEAIANKLPDVLYYDAEKLVDIGDHVTVADLIVPEGVEVKAEATQGIASVFEPSAVAAANDAAGGDAEPESAAAVEAEQGSVDETESAEAKATTEEAHEDKDKES
jgi:large subunit ribosomal protein L25